MPKKIERGTLLLWNGFVFHVRGFGCVQNEVLSTYGKVHNAKKVAQGELFGLMKKEQAGNGQSRRHI